MSAFLLLAKDQVSIVEPDIQKVMSAKGFKNPLVVQFPEYQVYQYNKINGSESYYRLKDNHHFFFTGTAIYKNTDTVEKSLDTIVESILNNEFNFNNIRGAFSILYVNPAGNFFILTDQAGISNVYYNTANTAFSNLFLAAIFATKGKLSLNKMAATEVIISGRQIGPDTLLNEIKRYEVFTDKESIGPLSIINDAELISKVDPHPTGFEEQTKGQIEELDRYFNDIKAFAENYGVDSGLTGGHDSRMMLIMLKRHLHNFSFHSLWRKKEDVELSVAREVAKAANIELKVIPAKHHFDKSGDEMAVNLENALLFYDGHIRMHCFLTEEYNTMHHRIVILGDKKIGINGIGGEQYRNEEHMQTGSWSMRYFIRYFLGYHISGSSFTDKEFEENYFEYLKNKVIKRLDLKVNQETISRYDVKRYMNEIYVSSLMGARTNAENQLTHFITPYVDRQLTRSAYKAVNYLGVSFNFQQAMIRKLSPELAAIKTGYGYTFKEGEPFKKKIKYLLKEITPRNLYQLKLNKAIDAKGNDEFLRFLDQFPILNISVEGLRKYNLPLNELRITSCPDLMPVYLSLAFFLHYLKINNKVL